MPSGYTMLYRDWRTLSCYWLLTSSVRWKLPWVLGGSNVGWQVLYLRKPTDQSGRTRECLRKFIQRNVCKVFFLYFLRMKNVKTNCFGDVFLFWRSLGKLINGTICIYFSFVDSFRYFINIVVASNLFLRERLLHFVVAPKMIVVWTIPKHNTYNI